MKTKSAFLALLILSVLAAHATVFNVTVPEGTQKCYVVGAFNGWNPGNALEMQMVTPTHFRLDAPEVISVGSGFKYICGPSWTYVEKDADGMEVPNRTVATEMDVVPRWAALYLPDLAMGSVTIHATVPENTPANSVFIYGSFKEWIVTNALRMEMVSKTRYTITIDNVTQFNYKLLVRRSTDYVEVDASGGDIPDRNAASNEPVVEIVVEAWKNLPRELIGVTYLENEVAFSPVSERRSIWVYLPPGYDANPDTRYPVMYMHDGQAVFSDEEGHGTWDVSETLNAMHAAGLDVGIVVATDRSAAYIREYSPWENEVFSRTGDGDLYLQALVSHVMPYVNANYRTLTGPEHTAIAGSNMGGLISLYGALKYQQHFGKAGVFSPFIWFNLSEIKDFVGSWDRDGGGRMHLSVGSLEGVTMNRHAEEMAELLTASGYDEESFRFEVFSGGRHDNASWARQFRAVYSFLFGIPYEPDSDPDPDPNKDTDPDPDPDPDPVSDQDVLYQFMSHSGSSVACSGDEPFVLESYYPTGMEESEVALHSYLKVIPVEFKSTWYWNINRGGDCQGENLFQTNRSIGFSGSKAYESWFRVILREDETQMEAAASSNFFRVKTADGLLTLMKRTRADGSPGEDDTFTVSADVEFPAGVKGFEVRFGSVNSGAVMGSLVGASDTYPLKVPDDWTKATIIYDFRTNLVTMREAADDVVLPRLTKLMAVPPVTNAGTPVTVTAAVDDLQSYGLRLEMSYNGGPFNAVDHAINEEDELEYRFTAEAGTYHIRLIAVGSGELDDLAFDGIVVRAGDVPLPPMALAVNAYAQVNWATTQRNKANFHLHTDWTSDSSMPAHEVVDLYHAKGFKILPITNHNFSSYPWFLFSMFKTAWQDRDDQELGMITFPGNELSANNHHNDYFTGRNDTGADLEASFALTQELGGFQLLNHPGQYWSIHTSYAPMQKNSPEWYADVFRRYESIVGLEVYNQGNKHPYDRVLWDEILTLTMPDRPVWGYSNDDAHHTNQAFFNYQFMLMETFDIPAVRKAMHEGTFYFSYEYGGTGNAMAPDIDRIVVDEESRTITVESSDGQVYWISGVDGEGSNRKSAVVGVGPVFVYDGFRGNYVRAFLKNRYGETGTQPFGFTEADVTDVQPVISEEVGSVVVYPNPTRGTLHVRSEDEMVRILLINAMGQVVGVYNAVGRHAYDINMHGLHNGVYVVSLRLRDKVVNKTVILSR